MATKASKPGKADQPPRQPDIDYVPDYEKYLNRVKKRVQSETLEQTLPPGFPNQLTSPLVWEGENISEEYDWIYEFSSDEIEEIEQGLRHFKALGKPLGYISQETFPLPKLHLKLRMISREIHLGHGFKILRGLPVAKYTLEDNIIIYAGVSSHVAPLRARQNSQYQGRPADVMLSHIKDLRNVDKDLIGVLSYAAVKQYFHTDVGDILSLFALSTSAQGGQSKLSSSWRVYNELAKTRPDLIWTLIQPWVGEEYGNPEKPFTLRPLLHRIPANEHNSEKLIIQYARRTYTGYHAIPRSLKIPPITEAQAEALDALHFLAERFALILNFNKGDIQFVNNLSIVHARESFEDTPEQQRHLIRLWLKDPEYAWPTPVALEERWKELYENVKPEMSVFPLEPLITRAEDEEPGQKGQ